ncbi:hypothetical protein OROHE_024538 [Orobanche hederae]
MSDCSDVPIIKALHRGVRVIKLDIWPNSTGDDVNVLHGMLQEETMLVGGLLSILQLSMGKATVGDASNCRNKPDKASVFMLQADCWKITLLGDEFRSRNMGP